jgi:hypothetical protein
MEVGDLQVDPDDSEWVVIGIYHMNGQEKASRVRRNSDAHRVHASVAANEKIAESLDKEVDGSETASAERTDTSQ